MRLLLDTHALLWWWNDDAQLSSRAREAIADRNHEVLVSAASAWEIATKQRLGKLPGVPRLASDYDRLVADDGFQPLPITAEHAWRAGAGVGAHRDPFDRLLAAQAETEQLVLVTRDAAFASFPVQTLW